MRFHPGVTDISASPISTAFAHLPDRSGRQDLLDLSQAAPSVPPAPSVARHIARTATTPDSGRYAPSLGLQALRTAFADRLSSDYVATLSADNVMITAGCNQAFCVVASALAAPGDEIIVCVPYYFNHVMWAESQGIAVIALDVDADGQPDPARAASLVTPRTRAILLVSPGNPTGVTMEPDRIECFAQVARDAGAALIVDETYRNFRGSSAAPHSLFAAPDWPDHVVSLHSFSKDLAIPGYRVGAVVGGGQLIEQAAKLLDCVAISAPRIGQEAALAGLEHAEEWRRRQAERIDEIHQVFQSVMADRPGGFELVWSGAFFGWVRHPYREVATTEVVRRLVVDHDVLVIPGTAFTPGDSGFLRFSFANLVPAQLEDLADRLRAI